LPARHDRFIEDRASRPGLSPDIRVFAASRIYETWMADQVRP